jgi:hypothetical protein
VPDAWRRRRYNLIEVSIETIQLRRRERIFHHDG